MSIGSWIAVWQAVTIAGLGVFLLMAVWVTTAGYRDIRSLYASLGRRRGKRRGR